MNIKSFLSGLLLRIKALFASLPEEVREVAHVAVTITENIKTFVDDPVVDILTAIIPGSLDDDLVRFLRLRLPVIVQQLRLVDSPLTTAIPSETVKDAAKTIQHLDGDLQRSFLHDLAVIITRELAAMGQVDFGWSDAVHVIEWYYKNKFNRS